MKNNVFKKWKQALETPEKVEVLKLDVRQLPRVTFPAQKPMPPDIGQMRNLRELEIRARNLEGLCNEMAQLQQLESLEISNSETEMTFGDVLATLSSLRSLELYNVGIRGPIPLPVGLRQLSLEANDDLDLDTWCTHLQSLPELRTLNLSSACPVLPETAAGLHQLEELLLAGNAITSLPDLSNMQSLRTLGLQSNSLAELPETIRRMPSLRTLWLAHNPLKDLPDWIGELHGLRELDISMTELNDLPPAISALPLEQLRISAPDGVIAELENRMPNCNITQYNQSDFDREVAGWTRFFCK